MQSYYQWLCLRMFASRLHEIPLKYPSNNSSFNYRKLVCIQSSLKLLNLKIITSARKKASSRENQGEKVSF